MHLKSLAVFLFFMAAACQSVDNLFGVGSQLVSDVTTSLSKEVTRFLFGASAAASLPSASVSASTNVVTPPKKVFRFQSLLGL
ncbi:unnamed protein product [Plutella xylostella]|uniref:(diamondback moth) hypothetical protein n=1 Tax=Plutella xylostella TaxID=51655 RepID=A0A8S4E7A9_PLUXY|nr:unnamed protein product [Plutella xylostella]